jgi:peptide/nickel transport system substrate-binding protein
MRGMSRVTGVVLVLSLLAGMAWGQAGREVVVVGMEAEPPNLDPAQVLGLHSMRVTHQLFETLVNTPDDSTEIIPGLAESWQVSADGLAWTFKLRRGVRSHDGTPLDAAAVKFFNRKS